MNESETPKPGALDNPDWTDEQNLEFDKGTSFKTTEQARKDALALDDEVGVKAVEVAKRTIKPVYGPIQREIADSDARVQPAVDQTAGGAEILDMDPAKRAHDLERLEEIRQNLESSSEKK